MDFSESVDLRIGGSLDLQKLHLKFGLTVQMIIYSIPCEKLPGRLVEMVILTDPYSHKKYPQSFRIFFKQKADFSYDLTKFYRVAKNQQGF